MSDIQSIADIQRLVVAGFSDWSSLGNVAVKRNEAGNLLLFNYTQLAQIAGRWNYFEQVSRGLILDARTGEVVARAFDKFFNWGEGGRMTSAPILSVTEKMDGSLGILYRDKDTLKVATRGSFNSEQAQWATEWLNRRYSPLQLDLLTPSSSTLLCEIIYPSNRVVVDYGEKEGLVLLAIRHHRTGAYWKWSRVQEYGLQFGLPVPVHYEYQTIDHIEAARQHLTRNQEGWVVEFADGQRFKFKGAEYLKLHRIISHLSFKNTLVAHASNGLGEWLDIIPDEFLGDVRGWIAEIEDTIKSVRERVTTLYEQAPKEARRDYALWVRDTCPDLSPYMFAALDGKPLEPLIYKHAFKKQEQEEAANE